LEETVWRWIAACILSGGRAFAKPYEVHNAVTNDQSFSDNCRATSGSH
jgi:hypothetical protein